MKPGGIEYVLTACQEPVLYVIKRQQRLAPDRARQEAFYYVLHGSIYMAPCLHTCLTSRLKRCLFSLESAFSQLQHDLEPLEWKERERTKRANKAQKLMHTKHEQQPNERVASPEIKAEVLETADVPDTSLNEQDVHGYTLPPKPLSMAHMEWLRQTDQVLLSVLSRCDSCIVTYKAFPMHIEV